MKRYRWFCIILLIFIFAASVFIMLLTRTEVLDLTKLENINKLERFVLEDNNVFLEFVKNPEYSFLKQNAELYSAFNLKSTEAIIINNYREGKWIHNKYMRPGSEYRLGAFTFTFEELLQIMSDEGLKSFLYQNGIKKGSVESIKLIDFSKYGLPVLFWVKTDKENYYIVKDYNESYMDKGGERMIYKTYTSKNVSKAFN